MTAEGQCGDWRDSFLTVDATVSYGNDLFLEILISLPSIMIKVGHSLQILTATVFNKPLNTVHLSWTLNWKPVPFPGKEVWMDKISHIRGTNLSSVLRLSLRVMTCLH